jgi:hypothetical protein
MFRALLTQRTHIRDNSGDFVKVEFLPISGIIPAADPETALRKAQELHPLFPHRLAVEPLYPHRLAVKPHHGDHHAQN